MRKIFIVLAMNLISLPALAHDRNCFVSRSQCMRTMTTSMSNWLGVTFTQACEEQNAGDFASFHYTYSHRSHWGAYGSFMTCQAELRRSLAHFVNDLVIYSACEHSRGGERTSTGGRTPHGQFCFEYRVSR